MECQAQTSKLLWGVTSLPGGFDSHAPSPRVSGLQIMINTLTRPWITGRSPTRMNPAERQLITGLKEAANARTDLSDRRSRATRRDVRATVRHGRPAPAPARVLP